MNSRGQTYGSNFNTTNENEVQAMGTNGKVGYVYAKDLDGKMPFNPEEAIMVMESQKKDRTIPLYKSDRMTVIGKFIITGTENGEVTSITQEEVQNVLSLND